MCESESQLRGDDSLLTDSGVALSHHPKLTDAPPQKKNPKKPRGLGIMWMCVQK